MAVQKRLGEIFVEQEIVSAKTVERVLVRAKALGRRFGTVLEEMELVTGAELAAALGLQYGFKVVENLAKHTYTPALMQLIPVEVAMQHLLFPLRREGSKLALAMADPTDTKVAGNIAADNGLTVVPFIASKSDIYDAICRHYLGREPTVRGVKTVLVAEDDTLMLTVLADALTSQGYRVVKAHDGIEAFKMAIAEKPDVVITDKMMPKLDGYGLFDALQNVPETMFTPVILVSGAMREDEEARAFEKGFFDFIVKPVSEITLVTRVKRAFFFHEHHYRLL